jgi:hypothetical protein
MGASLWSPVSVTRYDILALVTRSTSNLVGVPILGFELSRLSMVLEHIIGVAAFGNSGAADHNVAVGDPTVHGRNHRRPDGATTAPAHESGVFHLCHPPLWPCYLCHPPLWPFILTKVTPDSNCKERRELFPNENRRGLNARPSRTDRYIIFYHIL